jgi:hypothetical protein
VHKVLTHQLKERALADMITAGINRIVGRLLAAGYEGAFDLGEVEALLARLGA